MATLMAEYRICILSMFFLMLFFLWMDISLYYKVQGIKPHELYSENVVKNENLDSKHNPLIISRPEGPEILQDGGSITPTVKHGELFSPFKGLSVKMMMMDQTNNYVFTPLAEIFCDMTNFTYNFPSITPNLISFVGILWAFLAGKLVTYDSIAIHRLSVLFFQFRTFCDALDGIVARAHLGITHHVSLSNTPGYIVDGIADSIGFGAYLIGCYIFLRRTLHKHRYTSPQYLPLQHFHEGDKISQSSFVIAQYMPSKLIWTSRQVFFVVTCFALQLAISCVFWNRYIEAYHKLLENPPATQAQLGFQNAVLKSSIMWVIMWFWRISNAQSLMQMLLISVYVNRLWSFLTWIQYIGFIELLTLSFFTEAHLNHVKSIRPLG